MTDRELLDLAARALGPDYVAWSDAYKAWRRTDVKEHFVPWRPLTDPGDALRLDVALHIELKFQAPDYRPYWTVIASERGDGAIASETGPDAIAPTKRATVRAAAEIGRAKT